MKFTIFVVPLFRLVPYSFSHSSVHFGVYNNVEIRASFEYTLVFHLVPHLFSLPFFTRANWSKNNDNC